MEQHKDEDIFGHRHINTSAQPDVLTVRGGKPFPFMPLKWPFLLFSLACFALSLYVITVKGFNFGVDFLGGTKIVYEFDAAMTADAIRSAAVDDELGDIQIIPFGSGTANQFIIRAKFIEGKDVGQILDGKFATAFGDGKVKNLGVEAVGPKVGEDLRRKGLYGLIWTCVLILIYVGFRFDFLFAPGAIVALIHDVTISAGVFAWFGKEFNLPILAALLTILGYSINDTIVIYDRIRENILKLPKHTPLEKVIDVSLTETFSRTIVTSLTVFIVVVTLFFMGGAVLHDFSFCLIIGLIFGSYSSLFVASPIYLWLQKFFPTQGLKKTPVAPQPGRKSALAA